MAGLGATVIKVEDPDGGDLARANAPYVGRGGLHLTKEDETDRSLALLNRNRDKRSVTLNLKAPRAVGVFLDLVRQADVVVENFSSGTAERLGVHYEAARTVNERIIYCSISGFGADADPGERALDLIIQAMSGVMLASGEPGDPPVRVGFPLADTVAPLFAVIGILAALHRREETDRGQRIDISMLGALTSLVAVEDWAAFERLGQPLRTGLTLHRVAPFGLYRCVDGYVTIVALQDKMVGSLLSAMGRPELIEDPRFASRDARVTHHQLVDDLVDGWTSQRTVEMVVSSLRSVGVLVASVRSPVASVSDPRVISRSETLAVVHPEFGEIEGLRTVGVPIVFSEDKVAFSSPAPDLGQHNQEIYGGLLGYSAERLSELRADGTF